MLLSRDSELDSAVDGNANEKSEYKNGREKKSEPVQATGDRVTELSDELHFFYCTCWRVSAAHCTAETAPSYGALLFERTVGFGFMARSLPNP